MSDIPNIVVQLKKHLKRHQLTYADVALQLQLSEASIKRLFANQGFSLHRLERICQLMNLTLNELIVESEKHRQRMSELSLTQERTIVADTALLLVTYLVLNRWTFSEIVQTYTFSETDLIQLLAKLDRMKIIELQPNNRIRLLTSRDFRWIKMGPIEQFVTKNVKNAFLNAPFNRPEESLKLVSGLMSKTSMMKVKQKLEKVEQDIHQIVEQDMELPLSDRKGFSALLAIRFWEFGTFAKLKRHTNPSETPD